MLTWAPGQQILYHWPGNRNFHLLDPVTGEEKPLVDDDSVSWMFNPSYSPDGRKVAVFWNRPPERGLWVVSLDDSSETLVKKGPILFPICWSSEGDWIYATDRLEGMRNLLRVHAGGTKTEILRTLPDKSGGDFSITPDGRNLVYSVFEGRSDIWLVENFDPALEATVSQ